MQELAPAIYRQRLVVEGIPSRPLTDTDVSAYLSGLSEALDMRALIPPVTHLSPMFGWAGWIHWETSGAHMYAWNLPQLFFSVDIYTCKPFDVATAVEFTATVLSAQQITHGQLPESELVWPAAVEVTTHHSTS